MIYNGAINLFIGAQIEGIGFEVNDAIRLANEFYDKVYGK